MVNKILLISLSFIFCFSLVYAWPYQLNLSTGVITDLNISNNVTSNLTIYIISNQTPLQNITQNISYQNITCVNCTYLYNMSLSWANWTYNFTEMDVRFVKLVDFNNYKANIAVTPTRADYDNLLTRVNNISLTMVTETAPDNTLLWFISILSIILAGLSSVIAYRSGNAKEVKQPW